MRKLESRSADHKYIHQFLQLRKLPTNTVDVCLVSVVLFTNRIADQYQFDNIGVFDEVERVAPFKLTQKQNDFK